MMKTLTLLATILLLLTVVGCGSVSDTVVGPDTTDSIQTERTNDPAAKPAQPHEPPGDPSDLGDGYGGPH